MKYLPVLSLTALSVSSVYAANFDPAPYMVTDGFAIVPQIEADLRYDDNVYSDESNTTSSSIYLLKPSIKFGTDDGINRYGGSYTLTSGTYSHGSEDDFLDHYLGLLAHTEYSSKHRTDIKLSFENTHEDRGSAFTELDADAYDEPLKYNQLGAQGYFQYGGLNSIMRIGGGLAYLSKTYQNFTDDTKYSDFSGIKIFTDADYQLGNVTFLTLDIFSNDVKYDHLVTGGNSKDNRDTNALVGVKWEGLGKTTGALKVGYQYKTFESDARNKFSGTTLDLGVTWKPLEYSSLTLHINRNAQDTDTVGDYLEVLGTSLAWDHDWTEDFSSSVQFIYTNDDYIGASRSDDTTNAMLYLNYDLTRWIQIKAGYEHTTKDSDATNVSYDKNAVNLGFVVAL